DQFEPLQDGSHILLRWRRTGLELEVHKAMNARPMAWRRPAHQRDHLWQDLPRYADSMPYLLGFETVQTGFLVLGLDPDRLFSRPGDAARLGPFHWQLPLAG